MSGVFNCYRHTRYPEEGRPAELTTGGVKWPRGNQRWCRFDAAAAAAADTAYVTATTTATTVPTTFRRLPLR